MPEVDVPGGRIWFEVTGRVGAPALLLVHALGTTADLWTPQLDRCGRLFTVVRYDARGHGRSVASDGDYTLDRLGRDAVAVLDAAGVARAHVCGVSLGGLVALWLGIEAPARVDRLVAANTAARVGSPELWDERIRTVRAAGLDAAADTVVARWFTERFRARDPATVARCRAWLATCPVAGYTGSCAALRDADLRDAVARIAAPTLVITGTDDVATPPAAGLFIRDRVAGARAVELDAAHLANIEQADAFTDALLDFLPA